MLHPKPACRGGSERATAGGSQTENELSGLQLGNVQRVPGQGAGAWQAWGGGEWSELGTDGSLQGL